LFPGIKLAVGGVPAYGKVVYADFHLYCSEKTELLLIQSLSGYNLDSHSGLLGFLRECEYMSPAKLDRFQAAGRVREVDSKGHEVVSEGIFSRDPDVFKMYFFCSTLRISNRIFMEERYDSGYVLDVMEAPLYDRLKEADRAGPVVLMEKIVRFLDSFFSRDIRFKAKGKGRMSGFERMQRVVNGFNHRLFKNFKLSGNRVEDAYVFLTFFGEVV
jgi:hypothetical protein